MRDGRHGPACVVARGQADPGGVPSDLAAHRSLARDRRGGRRVRPLGLASAARRRADRSRDRDRRAAHAGPRCRVLLLAALSLAGEAAATRSAEADVSLEAAAASRLAWSATTPGVDTEAIHGALATYLDATVAHEWSPTDQRGDDGTRAAIADLEVAVRDSAVADDLGSAPAGELLGALDSVTSLRRQRLAVADQALPDFYVAVVVVSGLALIVNSAAVAVRARRRAAALTAGLVVVVSLAVALLFALAAPYEGGFVSTTPRWSRWSTICRPVTSRPESVSRRASPPRRREG